MHAIEKFKQDYVATHPDAKFGETHLAAQCMCGDDEPLIHYCAVRKNREMLDMHWDDLRVAMELRLERIPLFASALEFLPYANRWFICKELDTLYPGNALAFTKAIWFDDYGVMLTRDCSDTIHKHVDWHGLHDRYAFAPISAPNA